MSSQLTGEGRGEQGKQRRCVAVNLLRFLLLCIAVIFFFFLPPDLATVLSVCLLYGLPAKFGKGSGEQGAQARSGAVKHLHLLIYVTLLAFLLLRLGGMLLLILFCLLVLIYVIVRIWKIREKKRKHILSEQIMEQLVKHSSIWEYNATRNVPLSPDPSLIALDADKSPQEEEEEHLNHRGQEDHINEKEKEKMAISEMVQKVLNVDPRMKKDLRHRGKHTVVVGIDRIERHAYRLVMEMESENKKEIDKKETPLLVAARAGVSEMVKKILNTFPVAIQDVDRYGKNVLLLAVENRHPHIYKFLHEKYSTKDNLLQKVDNNGNSALHLAAMLGQNRPWLIPGAALQLQWEIKWYKFVKKSIEGHFYARHNIKGQTPKEVFTDSQGLN